jgi:hypothetical protein
MSRPVKYGVLGSRPREREKDWWLNRPDWMVDMHCKLRSLDRRGKRGAYLRLCRKLERMLVERGELRCGDV